jgi:ABC-2 type transport system permease protein
MVAAIWGKELRERLHTWKGTVWLILASLIFSLTSYLLLTNKELSLLDQTELLWLLGKIIVTVSLAIVVIDASLIINAELERETAESLFLTPLTLGGFLTGKFLAVMSLWLALYLVAVPYMIVTSAGTNVTRAFLFYVGLLGSLGIAGVVLMLFALSLVFRSSRNTLTTGFVLLLAMAAPALFSSTLKNNTVAQAFGRVNPLDNIFSALDNVLVDYQRSLGENARFLWPLLLFLALTLLAVAWASRRFQRQGVVRSG